jgi:hypothetical protein
MADRSGRGLAVVGCLVAGLVGRAAQRGQRRAPRGRQQPVQGLAQRLRVAVDGGQLTLGPGEIGIAPARR